MTRQTITRDLTQEQLDVLRRLDFDLEEEHHCNFAKDGKDQDGQTCGKLATHLAYCPCNESDGSAICAEHVEFVRKRSRWSIWQVMRLEGMNFGNCNHTVPGWKVRFVPIR